MVNKKQPAWKAYISVINEIVEKVVKTQGDNFEKAASYLADCVEQDGIIHTFGVGHSHITSEEVFNRAATLAPVHAILEPSMTGHTEITKSGKMEKLEGTGEILADYHRMSSPDTLIAISHSGNNAVTIDLGIAARKRGMKVVVITSIEYSEFLKPLHSSGKKLKDTADVVLDTCCPIGDAALEFSNLKQKVGPTSGVLGMYIINAVLARTVEILLERGFKPDVYYNGSLGTNIEGVREHNNNLVDKYFARIRNL